MLPSRSFHSLFLLALVAAALSGCNSGGSHGGAAASSASYATPNNNFVAFNGTIQSTGVGVTQVLNANGSAQSVTVASGPQAYATTVSPGVNNSASQNIQLTAPVGSTATMAGNINGNGTGIYQGSASNSGDNIALNNVLGATSLSYSYVGGGAIAASGSSIYTYMLFGGQKTTDMPTSGKANYSGTFAGIDETLTAGAFPAITSMKGAANLAADFSAGTITGGVTNLGAPALNNSTTPMGYDITMNGTISGNTFGGAATLTQTGTTTPLTGASQTSNMQGGFFGPQAAEATGGIAISSVSTSATKIVTGFFGTKKQ